jgi:hypothetical protein
MELALIHHGQFNLVLAKLNKARLQQKLCYIVSMLKNVFFLRLICKLNVGYILFTIKIFPCDLILLQEMKCKFNKNFNWWNHVSEV